MFVLFRRPLTLVSVPLLVAACSSDDSVSFGGGGVAGQSAENKPGSAAGAGRGGSGGKAGVSAGSSAAGAAGAESGGGSGGTGGVGPGGTTGTGGTGGGPSGASGAGASPDGGGSGGEAGQPSVAGAAGIGGETGGAGSGGTTGGSAVAGAGGGAANAGVGGNGGDAGSAGSSSNSAGAAGATGSAGGAGTAGNAGTSGGAGSAGNAGTSGGAGSAGNAGTSGGGAGAGAGGSPTGDACADALAAMGMGFEGVNGAGASDGLLVGGLDGFTTDNSSWPHVQFAFGKVAGSGKTSGPSECAGGAWCAGSSFSSDYVQCSRTRACIPARDLSVCAGRQVKFVFDHWYDFSVIEDGGTYYDGGFVEFSSAGPNATTWTQADGDYPGTVRINGELGGYSCQAPSSFYVNGKEGYVGDSGGVWTHAEFVVPSAFLAKNFSARFVWSAGVSYQTVLADTSRKHSSAGWYIDNIGFTVAP